MYLFPCMQPFPLARSFVPPPIRFFSHIFAAIGPFPMAPSSPPRPRHCAHPTPSPLSAHFQPSPNFSGVNATSPAVVGSRTLSEMCFFLHSSFLPSIPLSYFFFSLIYPPRFQPSPPLILPFLWLSRPCIPTRFLLSVFPPHTHGAPSFLCCPSSLCL
ncbi:hypothetical protein C8J57DRAFT_1338636 [Mycena rebaudengoi]|nr:hypothetical protein C8J57DRAFT_1338636 [Mycena rebaudengoi]